MVGNDPDVIERARFLAAQAREHSELGAYEHTALGYNYRLSNLLAALGRGQLGNLDDKVTCRRSIFERYRTELAENDQIEWMPEAHHGRSTRWLSCCLLKDKQTRDKVIMHLREKRIESRPVWKPMHLQELYATSRYETHDSKSDVSAAIFERGLCLPSGSGLTHQQQTRVINALEHALK